jgi:2-keto-4-pentenoate hydratase/2-oxohepta-3-ene-1,7-dioic acid hydratase in catechol pathway
MKATTSVVGTNTPVRLPAAAPDLVDFEGEVAVIIGRPATAVSEASAWSYVAALTACNDVTARDVQRGMGNSGLAKSFDTFSPIGGSAVTPDEYDDPDDVGLQTLLNGTAAQRARTAELLFNVPYLVSWLSRYTTLEPGDVITTGTPGRLGPRDQRFLAPGDVVEVHVDRVVPLVCPVTA